MHSKKYYMSLISICMTEIALIPYGLFNMSQQTKIG